MLYIIRDINLKASRQFTGRDMDSLTSLHVFHHKKKEKKLSQLSTSVV